MRCPKCHYLSFDPEPRCKNCGYDLEVADAELALRTVEPVESSVPDLHLRDEDMGAPVTLELVRSVREDLEREGREESEEIAAPVRTTAPAGAVAVLEIVQPPPVPPAARVAAPPPAPPAARVAAPLPAPPVARVAAPPPAPPVARVQPPLEIPPAPPQRAPHTTTELPLFVKNISQREAVPVDDPVRAARIPIPPAPRPPLAVRRPVADPSRPAPRVERRVGPLDHDLLEDLRRVEQEEAAFQRAEARAHARLAAEAEAADLAPLSTRLRAAAIDGALLGLIGAFVLWATLRLCDVGLWDLGAASWIPLAVFLSAVSVSYILMFTAAGGQTVGKMAMGIRVVRESDDAEDSRLTWSQAAWRAILAPLSLIVLGAGWVPALLGGGEAVHDRLLHTRVVRA